MKFFNYAALIVVVPAVLACNGTTQPLSELPTPTATAAPPPTATPEPTPTPTPIPTSSPTPEPESLPKTLSGIRPLSVNSDSDAEEILNAALEAMDNLDSLHFSLQAEVGITSADLTATFPFAFEGDYQAPDRMKGKLALSLGFFALEMEIINIGPDTYTTDPQTGLWQQTDDNAAGGVSPTEIIGLASDFGADGLSVVGEETLGDGTAVVHLVGVIRERGAYTFDAVNRVGTANVVDAAREAGVRVFVHVSALGVSDSPDFPYLLSKWRGEQAVINGGVPYTILRSSTYFGPGDRFIGTLAALVKAFPIIPVPGNGRTLYQPLHVEDMARCVASALKLPEPRGQTVDLGGPRHLTHDQILDTIARTYHLKRLKFHVPLALMRMMVAIMERLAPSPPATLHQLRMLSVDSVTELDSVERIFGFQPRPLDGAIDYIRDMSYWEALKLSLGFSRRRGPPSRRPEP